VCLDNLNMSHAFNVLLPSDLQQSLRLAGEYRRAGRLPQAEQILRDALGRYPAHPLLLGQLGELLLFAGNFDAALPLLERARQHSPGEAQMWLIEAQCLLALGRHKDAKKLLTEAIAHGLRHPLTDRLLDEARSGGKGKPSAPAMPLKDLLRQLDGLLQGGRLAEAENLADAGLRAHPRSAQLCYRKGMTLLLQGRAQDAVEPLRHAVQFDPHLVPAHYNLAYALDNLERDDEALEAYRRTVKLAPQLVEAHNNMGNILQRLKRHDEALAAYGRAVALKPDFAPFRMNRGDALRDLGRLEEAEAAYRDAIQRQPDLAEAYLSLAYTLALLLRYEETVVICQTVIERWPNTTEAYHSMGKALRQLGRHHAAADVYRRLVDFQPDDFRAFVGLAEALREACHFEAALDVLEQTLNRNPHLLVASDLKAGILHVMGRNEEAIETYRQGLALSPGMEESFPTHSSLLLTMNYQDGATSDALLAEARAFGANALRRAKSFTAYGSSPDTERRLRIGLVSGDFGVHPVGFFLEQVLKNLDTRKLELVAYATSDRRDPLNARLRDLIPHWLDARTVMISDGALANRIHADGIDILVDLAGHTGKNRLPVFAWKPAPVQVSWLGYLGTTGLEAMDYILADEWALPRGEEAQFTETPWRLPGSYICFSPPDVSVDVGQLPALGRGYVTFGCFNNLNKITDQVIACWARILQTVPSASLFLKTKSLGDEKVRERITESFLRSGVGPERLILDGQFASHEEHFRAYRSVDIALDPFPYPGITTTVEALWMGVPVLSLKGDRFISHQGETILNNVGLPQWIAADEDGYVAKAAAFANDLPALATLRAGLREQLLASPLCDAPRFARNLEEALRGMWRIWCEKQQAV
jgi:protein O-GlcNAc transferase